MKALPPTLLKDTAPTAGIIQNPMWYCRGEGGRDIVWAEVEMIGDQWVVAYLTPQWYVEGHMKLRST
jgi:choline dehydrogenase-like flavoprotein